MPFLNEMDRQNDAKKNVSLINLSSEEGIFAFGVTITYSLDGEDVTRKIVSNYYTNNLVVAPVRQTGRINTHVREVLQTAPQALYQPWYIIYEPGEKQGYCNGILYDCN